MSPTLRFDSRPDAKRWRRTWPIQCLRIGAGSAIAQSGTRRVIASEARRFQYTPNLVALKCDDEVTLAFHSIDFIHGFHAPDFDLRADLRPGRITTIEWQPVSAGRFPVLCDNFCGDGHEAMSSIFAVEA